MLTLIILVAPDPTFALNSQKLFREYIQGDTLKLKKKVYLKEVKSQGSSMTKLDSDELDSISRYLIMDTDTGKYFHRFLFKDGKGINRRFVDSLILGFPKDSVLRRFGFHADSIFQNRIRVFPDHRDNSIEMPNMLRRAFPPMHTERFALPRLIPDLQKNAQVFSFRNTDKNGINTHMRIDVNDPSDEELKKITGSVSENKLMVDALGFSPDFSSQTILLTFKLSTKGSASVNILDGDLKNIYSDNTSKFPGRYSKEISLPRNGIYFLVIRQNNRSFVKRLIKQG